MPEQVNFVAALLGFAACVAAYTRAAFRRGERVARGWESVAKQLGLRLLAGFAMEGGLQGLPVAIRSGREGAAGGAGEVVVSVEPLVPAGSPLRALVLRRRDAGAIIHAARGDEPRELLTGDGEFDGAASLFGDEQHLAALLTADARRALADFARAGGSIEGTTVRLPFECANDPAPKIARAAMLAQRAALAMRLADLREGLERNARADPSLAVRMHCLRLLHERHPGTVERERALQAALRGDSVDDLRAAARMMGHGPATDAVLAERLAQASAPTEVRLFAFRQLLPSQPREAIPIICTALRARDPALRLAGALSLLLLHDRAPEMMSDEALRSALVRAQTGVLDERLGAALARAFGTFADARGERALIEFLEHESEAVQRAAIASLAAVGTIAAIEPLLARADGGLLRARTNQAARDAMRTIQSRLGDVDAGRVSLAENPKLEGAVTLLREAGTVTLAAPPEAPHNDADEAGAASADQPLAPGNGSKVGLS